MPWVRVELDFDSPALLTRINNQIANGVSVTGAKASRKQVVSFFITSSDESDKGDLIQFLQELGFTALNKEGEITSRRDWGVFDVASAPTVLDDGVAAYDEGFCTDGLSGLPTPVYFDGSNWLASVSGSAIQGASLGPISFAAVTNGGALVGTDGDYTATQASTSGTGSGAEFTVTVASGAVTAIVSIDNAGTNYSAGDTITLSISGVSELTAAELTVIATI